MIIDCPIRDAYQQNPHGAACITKSHVLSFQKFHEKIHTWEIYLDENNINPGDRIAMTVANPLDCMAILFAAFRKNASLAIFNPKLPLSQIELFLETIQPQHTIGIQHKTYPNEHPLFSSLLLATSGSSATPKIAVLSKSALYANARASILLTRQDKWLLSLPLYHVSGIGIVLRCALHQAAVVINPNDPEITHISCVPTQLYRASPAYKNLKTILLGGAPILLQSPYLPIMETYGLTEMGSMVLATKNPRLVEGKKYLGFPLEGREMRLHDDGEIWVKGSTLFTGYLEKGKCTELKQTWFPTKDLGAFHPEFGFAIVGRKDFQFISGGENIQPEEIEHYLYTIPDVIEAIVLPRQDPEWGYVPIAIIHSTNLELSLEKLREILCKNLPHYKIPKALHLSSEFPKKGTKIDRQTMIANYLK